LLTLRDAFTGKLRDLPVTRDLITVSSIDAALMLNEHTGYIKVNQFASNTYQEFREALDSLMKKGAKQLVLDLRDNPGGYLEAATSIANEFLDGRKMIVFTKGLHMDKTEYRADDNGRFDRGRLVVLINESSASASEIIAGAMQDWDRGVIIGRRSFGKGLVQEEFDLPDGAGLRLTIAKYYTPSGRCIQRPFEHGRDAYMADYRKRFTRELLGVIEADTVTDTTTYYTANKRKVYGGGGIKPDISMAYDTTEFAGSLAELINGAELKTAVWDYYARNHKALKYRDIKHFISNFYDEDNIVKMYMRHVKPKDHPRVVRLLENEKYAAYFRLHLKAQLARLLFHDNGYYAVLLTGDRVITRSMEVLGSDWYKAIITGQPFHPDDALGVSGIGTKGFAAVGQQPVPAGNGGMIIQ